MPVSLFGLCCILTACSPSKGALLYVPLAALFDMYKAPGSAGEASNSWVEFNYQDDTEGRLLTPVIFDLEPETFFLTDGHLDYSLVAVSDNAHDGGILQFGWNRLIEEQGKAIVGEYVNVVQHPNGEPKQFAFRERTG